MRVSVYGESDAWSSCETKNPRPHALKMEILFMLDGLYYLLKGELVSEIFLIPEKDTANHSLLQRFRWRRVSKMRKREVEWGVVGNAG